MISKSTRAIVIGAGPAGLTVASELSTRTGIKPVVLEKSSYMGGLARTFNHHGNRIDVGGHRFFSKSDRVMEWWLRFLPLEALADRRGLLTYHGRTRTVDGRSDGPDPKTEDRVMLLRQRRSRIYYRRKFFHYPVSLTLDTFLKLGVYGSLRIVASYLHRILFPLREEENLEQFLINRFGEELYRAFFKSYTEKVWGVPCEALSADWGAQRIRELSVARAVWHALARLVRARRLLDRRKLPPTLIEQFLYPKYGPGHLWEVVADETRGQGGEIHTEMEVRRILLRESRVHTVEAVERGSGKTRTFEADYVFSTMPVSDLLQALDPAPPPSVREVGRGLVYRDFVIVGLLLDQLEIRERRDGIDQPIRDNWVYLHEPDVRAARLQIFNNWSPWMVADPTTTWIGVEYFCDKGDGLWNHSDDEMAGLAQAELESIGLIDRRKVRDSVVLRVEKAYPAYRGTYDRFDEIRNYLDGIRNLFPLGRNGMHRYNNQDHSMLTAMTAVDNIVEGRTEKSNLWAVNTEPDYIEERRPSARRPRRRPGPSRTVRQLGGEHPR